MHDEAPRQRIIASDGKSRFVFAAIATVVPLLLSGLFARQEARLAALAEHGRVATATVDGVSRSSDGRDVVHYRYEVQGRPYTWAEIWDGHSLATGARLDVTYLPEDPALSRPGPYDRERLEAERNLPIVIGVPLGIFVFFGAFAWMAHRRVQRLRAGAPLSRRRISPDALGRGVAAILLLALLATNAYDDVQHVMQRAFGEAPFGLPVVLVVCVAEALLFAPYFWVMPHLMRIVVDAQARGASMSRMGVAMAVLRAGPELALSRRIVIAGLVWFVALASGWIVYADSLGI